MPAVPHATGDWAGGGSASAGLTARSFPEGAKGHAKPVPQRLGLRLESKPRRFPFASSSIPFLPSPRPRMSSIPSTASSPAPRRDAATIALVGYAHAVSHFFHLLIPVLFPWLMPAFGLSYTEVGAVMTLFFVLSGVGQALAGLVVDRTGPVPVLLGGVLCLAVAGFLLAAAQSYAMLFVVAAVAGLGNCVFHPADYTLLNRRVAKARLAHAFSVHGLSGNLGWGAAPIVLTPLAANSGWRFAAVVAGGLALLSLVFFFFWRKALTDHAAGADKGAGTASVAASVSTGAVLRSPAVLLCFAFFFLATVAFGAIQNYSPALFHAMYGLSLGVAAMALTTYQVGAAVGTAVGGFIAQGRLLERTVALCMAFAAGLSLTLACGVLPAWAILPAMALMGAGVGIAAPSRDLLIRQATTRGLGEASFGRVYGFVYSGLDAGLATAPLLFGALMDGAHYPALWLGVAIFQALAMFVALRVGRLNFA